MRFIALLCLLISHLHADPVSIIFVGDVNFTGRIGEQMALSGTTWPFAGVKDVLKAADYRVCNLENPAGVGGAKYCDKRIYFKANPKYLDALNDAGFNLVTLANNHALDYGPDVIKQTMTELDRRGIKHMGILEDNTKKNEPVIVNIKGLKIAFLAYCNACPQEFGPQKNSPGVSVGLGDWIRRQVADVKKQGVDYIIAMPHWGSEYYAVDKNQEYTGRVMREAGVDVVVGAHPHVLQKMEKIDSDLMLWSLGNFLFPMRWQISMDSVIVKVNLEKGKKITYDILPISLTSNRPIVAAQNSKTYKRVIYIADHGYQYNNIRTWPEHGPWDETKKP